ncbi:MAG: lysophospholipid acyltransferase family protein [Deltaproteobacteria bacterium]|nr:lysophospholipid acyltransferase family protein [Deltaproteobacteria bacterium]
MAALPLELLLTILAWSVSRLPLRVARGLGAALGWVWFHVVPIRRRVTCEALARHLGLDADRARTVAAALYRGLGVSAMELLWLRPDRPERLAALALVENVERFDRARARGRGVIVVTAHYGNWDAMACSQAERAGVLHVVTKRLSMRGIDRFWQRHRGRFGVRLHDMIGSAKAVMRALRSNETVALVVDQDTPPALGGAFVEFLGDTCATTTAPALLAARTGAALVPVRCERQTDGRLRIVVDEEVELLRDARGRVDILATTRRINGILEGWVRAHPEQWLWLHRRWKTRPDPLEIAASPKPARAT